MSETFSQPRRWLSRSGRLLQWLALFGALAYSLALYVANLLALPANTSVRQWWGSELAIRYCAGFVRRGLLGQLAWWGSGWFARQENYVALLTLAMAAATLGLGLWLCVLLRRACGWRLGLLILAAPVGWPVLMTHAAATFRKDALQILLGGLLLLLWSQHARGRSWGASPLAWFSIVAIQIAAVFIHEPFALLILPTLAIARFWERASLPRSLLAILPGLSALAVAILRKGSPLDVACLRADLQRLGLLAQGELPGSSIMELARSRPMFFTWNLQPSELAWSLAHGLIMSLVSVLAYTIVLACLRPHPTWLGSFRQASCLWALQLFVALPVFLTAIDYGRWLAMLFCVGLLLICLAHPGRAKASASGPGALAAPPGTGYPILGAALATLELAVLPSHCCTYGPRAILAFLPYAAASQWKALWLTGLSASLPLLSAGPPAAGRPL